MIINGKTLLEMAPIKDMIPAKRTVNGVSHGLTECGYDIRLEQEVTFFPNVYEFNDIGGMTKFIPASYCFDGGERTYGNLALGSSIEYFHMPTMLMGRVLNKSTWARKGLDASMTTNIEPGWRGNLTIELLYNGQEVLTIPAGAGICQVIFERILNAAEYEGKYQDQPDRPVEAITELGPICIMDAKGVYPERLDPIVKAQKAMLDPLYMSPDKRQSHYETFWNSFSEEQRLRLYQNAKAAGETIPDWMTIAPSKKTCEYCKGSTIYISKDLATGQETEVSCLYCDEKGFILNDPCSSA